MSPDQHADVSRLWEALWPTAQAIANAQAETRAADIRHRARVERYTTALARAQDGDWGATVALVFARAEAEADTSDGQAARRALEEVPGIRVWLAQAHQTAQAVVTHQAVTPPPPASAEPPQETLASLSARAVPLPVSVRRLLRAAHPDSPAPEPWRQRLEAALTTPNRLKCAYALRVLAMEVAVMERAANAFLDRLRTLETAAERLAIQARQASDRLDDGLRVASRDPEGDRHAIDQESHDQIAALADRPELLVSELRGGVVIGRAERREALKAAAGLVHAALRVRADNAAAQAAAQELDAWRATTEAQSGAAQRRWVTAMGAALEDRILTASDWLTKAAAVIEAGVSQVELRMAPVPAEYRQWVDQERRRREMEHTQDDGPSM